MLDQNFGADQDQNRAARNGGLGLIFRAEDVADQNTEDGKHKGCDANGGNRKPDVDLQKGERDADCQRVDAGGNGHQCQLTDRKAVRRLLLLGLTGAGGFPALLDGIQNHLAADQQQ